MSSPFFHLFRQLEHLVRLIYYFQYRGPGTTIQQYVGRRTPLLDRIVSRFGTERPNEQTERQQRQRLCAMLRAGGALCVGCIRGTGAIASGRWRSLSHGRSAGRHARISDLRQCSRGPLGGGLVRTDDIDLAGGQKLLAASPPTRPGAFAKICENLTNSPFRSLPCRC